MPRGSDTGRPGCPAAIERRAGGVGGGCVRQFAARSAMSALRHASFVQLSRRASGPPSAEWLDLAPHAASGNRGPPGGQLAAYGAAARRTCGAAFAVSTPPAMSPALPSARGRRARIRPTPVHGSPVAAHSREYDESQPVPTSAESGRTAIRPHPGRQAASPERVGQAPEASSRPRGLSQAIASCSTG